jgi:preprotein translocase subunit SecF
MWDFVGNRISFYIFSLVVAAVCLLFIWQSGLNLSIDFKSGSVIRLRFEEADLEKATAQQLREILSMEQFKKHFSQFQIQAIESADTVGGTGREFFVTSDFLPDKGVEGFDVRLFFETELRKTYPTLSLSEFRNIGPSIGDDLKVDALASIILSMLVIILYITIRFDFRFSIVSIIALVHDTVIVLGFFALLQKEFSPAIIAAILTLIGYSLNDTIVILDRIRENIRLMRKEKYSHIVNVSINQSISRTIKTSLTTLCPIVILFLWGGPGIADFSFAMLIGVIVGTYSSVCVAAPILVSWDLASSGSNPGQPGGAAQVA